jgi:hypothetical protein
MFTERRQPLATWISWAVSLCLILAGFLITGCEPPPASHSDETSSPTSTNEAGIAGVLLRADPNPVPPGNPNGKTTITWATGSDSVGDVYVVGAGKETLFASGTEGAQDAPWIHPGSNEFRLYRQDDHKLLAKLTVTMPTSDTAPNKRAAAPLSSPSP